MEEEIKESVIDKMKREAEERKQERQAVKDARMSSKGVKKVLEQTEVKEVKVKLDGEEGSRNTIEQSINKTAKIIDHSLDSSPKYSIPTNTKTQTQAFNVVMDKLLVKKLDHVCKKKGYSRNQLIGYICKMVIDDLEE